MKLSAALERALAEFFTERNIADVIAELPKPQCPIRDLLFPESRRKTKSSPYLMIADIEAVTGAAPVIKRGGRSYPVDGGKKSAGIFEVAPISLSKTLKAVDVNNASVFGDKASIDALLRDAIEDLRDRTVISTEVMACQALSGEISYPAVTAEGITDLYTVKLGNLKKAPDCDMTGKDIAALIIELEKQFVLQRNTGAAGDVRFLAGDAIYSRILEIITAVKGNVPVQWVDYGLILMGKYKIMPLSATYLIPGSTSAAPVIDSKTLQTIDVSNAGTLFYAALDEFDAKLQPLPFFSKFIPSDDPSGIKVLSSSKPLPAVAVTRSVTRKYLV